MKTIKWKASTLCSITGWFLVVLSFIAYAGYGNNDVNLLGAAMVLFVIGIIEQDKMVKVFEYGGA